MFRFIVPVAAAIVFSGLSVRPAPAVPLFARQYDVTCAKCHSAIPHLNDFGAAFMASGDRIPGVQPGPAFPVAAKANLVASSENQGSRPNGAGLPKAIVDELELFTSGAIGSRGTYFVEQYVIDGGMRGLARDAWIADRVTPWQARVPIDVQAGSFTLPLPVDPETFRDTYAGYALYEQQVGANPFTFFDPKIGVRLSVGDPLRGLNAQVVAGPGHDRQSGIASLGTDVMVYAQDTMGAATVSFYRYTGARPTARRIDDFSRTGVGLVFNGWGRLSSETVLQTGWDGACGTVPLAGCASSGGFSQVRYAISRRFFVSGRYEGTNGPPGGFTRDGVVLVGYAPAERARITLEDVLSTTAVHRNVMNAQFTIAY